MSRTQKLWKLDLATQNIIIGCYNIITTTKYRIKTLIPVASYVVVAVTPEPLGVSVKFLHAHSIGRGRIERQQESPLPRDESAEEFYRDSTQCALPPLPCGGYGPQTLSSSDPKWLGNFPKGLTLWSPTLLVSLSFTPPAGIFNFVNEFNKDPIYRKNY